MAELNKAVKDNKQLKTDLKRMYSNVTPYTLFICILSAAGTIAYFIVKKSYNNALIKEESIPAAQSEYKSEYPSTARDGTTSN
jgi:hypothetical protein